MATVGMNYDINVTVGTTYKIDSIQTIFQSVKINNIFQKLKSCNLEAYLGSFWFLFNE